MLQGRPDDAIESYRRSFALRPLCAAGLELEQLGVDLTTIEQENPAREARPSEILFEISDFFPDLLDSMTISGIQRVQLGILTYIVAEHRHGRGVFFPRRHRAGW